MLGRFLFCGVAAVAIGVGANIARAGDAWDSTRDNHSSGSFTLGSELLPPDDAAAMADEQQASAQADNSAIQYLDDASFNLAPEYASDTVLATQRAPLMGLLDKMGLAAPLERNGFNFYGVAEGSYSYNTADPHAFLNGAHKVQLRMYDHHSDQLILQRIDFFFDRVVNYHQTKKWDVGGLVEFQYGHDGAMMHSNGLLDYSFFGFKNEHTPYYQVDLTEAYLDLAVPVGNGLRVRVGKFATIMGYESCDPVHNQAVQFFSRSFILTYGIPMYQTGVYGTYDFNDKITANAGISRGWEQAVEDNNGAIDFLGSVNYVFNDNLANYIATSVGPENPRDNSHYRTVLEDVIFYTPDPRGPWNFALDALVGWEDNQVDNFFFFPHDHVNSTQFNPRIVDRNAGNTPVGNVSWAGVALFGGYRVNNNLQIKARAEWFQDSGGTRLRFPQANDEFTATTMNDQFVVPGLNYNIYEFTLGADWVPFPHDAPTLKIRPEIRDDYASRPILVKGRTYNQVTVAVDFLFRF